jgi:hypothetical protein
MSGNSEGKKLAFRAAFGGILEVRERFWHEKHGFL